MVTVWVLMIVYASQPFVGPTTIGVDSVVFESAARCLRNIDNVKKQFEKYDSVSVTCAERELNKDKKTK